jgi:hypothetical protein
LTNRFFLCSVVGRTVRKRFLMHRVIPMEEGQGTPRSARLFPGMGCPSSFSADALSWRTYSMGTRTLARALTLFVRVWAAPPCLPAVCASLRIASLRYQSHFRRAPFPQVSIDDLACHRRDTEGNAALLSSRTLTLICFQALCAHTPAGRALAALCWERHRAMILLAAC